jgi:hypothetical protein
MKPKSKEITLTGTIVTCDIRTTQPQPRTALRYNKLADRRVPTEVTPRERDYAVLKIRSRRTSVTHRCIAWDVQELSQRPIRWANPGDQVEITGTPEVVTLHGKDGQPFDLHQIVITGYKVLRKQPRQAVA